MLNATKTCSACKSELPIDSFNKDKSKKDGRSSACRDCNKAKSARWYADNKEAATTQRKERFQRKRDIELEQMRQWREANRDRKKIADDAWRSANIERVKLNALRWARANKASVYQRNAAYKRDNPQRVVDQSHRRRARKYGRGYRTVSNRDLMRLKARFNGCCAYCGAAGKITIDHVVPLSRGGSHALGNLTPACESCNFSKGDKLLIEWLAWRQKLELAA